MMEKAIQEGKALDMPNEIELEDEIVDELFEEKTWSLVDAKLLTCDDLTWVPGIDFSDDLFKAYGIDLCSVIWFVLFLVCVVKVLNTGAFRQYLNLLLMKDV